MYASTRVCLRSLDWNMHRPSPTRLSFSDDARVCCSCVRHLALQRSLNSKSKDAHSISIQHNTSWSYPTMRSEGCIMFDPRSHIPSPISSRLQNKAVLIIASHDG